MLATENFLACWVPLKVLSCPGARHLQIKSRTALLIAVAHTTRVSLLTVEAFHVMLCLLPPSFPTSIVFYPQRLAPV